MSKSKNKYLKSMKSTLPALIIIFVIMPILTSCSDFKDKSVPDTKIKEVLKHHFQDQLIKLECVGNNITFQFLEGLENSVEPKKALLTFKARVNIDNMPRTVVGNLKISAFISTRGFGNFSHLVIGVGSSLGDWHFSKPSDDTDIYCQGESFFSTRLKEESFKFNEHNSYFGTTHRLPIELDVGKKLCDYGEKKYCKYIYDYKTAAGPTTGNCFNV